MKQGDNLEMAANVQRGGATSVGGGMMTNYWGRNKTIEDTTAQELKLLDIVSRSQMNLLILHNLS